MTWNSDSETTTHKKTIKLCKVFGRPGFCGFAGIIQINTLTSGIEAHTEQEMILMQLLNSPVPFMKR